MKMKAATLTRTLGPKLAKQLGGGNAGANTQLIDSLPAAQKSVVRVAFAASLMPMWTHVHSLCGRGLDHGVFYWEESSDFAA